MTEADVDAAGFVRQKTALKEALQTYGTSNILGITVGNDFMVNYMINRENVTTNVNGPIGLAASALLKGNFTDIRQMITSINVNLPIGTGDTAFFFNADLLSASDFGCAFIIPQHQTTKVADLLLFSSSIVNVYAWYNNRRIQDAVKHSFDLFKERGVDLASSLTNLSEVYMAGVGWPTNSLSALTNPSQPSVKNLQLFINNFVCTANTQGVKYFFFEYMDTPWKEKLYGVEGFWGLFNSDRTLKAITLPDCTHV